MHPLIRRIAILFLALLSFFNTSASAATDELATRNAIETQIAALWKSRDFSGLEAQFQKYRDSRARTPSGIWCLSVANSGLDAAILREATSGSSWTSELAAARQWAAAFPESPVAQMAPARALNQQAWHVRGTGFIQTVDKADQAEFLRLAGQANSSLRAVKRIAAKDPSWYELAISLSLYVGMPVSESEQLFSEAIAKEPDYFQAYFVMSRRHDPRWGGSADSLENFVVKAISRLDDKAKDVMYLRIYWWVSELRYFDSLSDSRANCRRMMRGARIVAHDYPDRWNTNNLAKLASFCGDRESAKYFLNLVPGPPLMAAWGSPSRAEQNYARFRAWLEK